MRQKKQAPDQPPNEGLPGLMGRRLPPRPRITATVEKLDNIIDTLAKAKKKQKKDAGTVLACAACFREGKSPKTARACYLAGTHEGTRRIRLT